MAQLFGCWFGEVLASQRARRDALELAGGGRLTCPSPGIIKNNSCTRNRPGGQYRCALEEPLASQPRSDSREVGCLYRSTGEGNERFCRANRCRPFREVHICPYQVLSYRKTPCHPSATRSSKC